MGICDGRVVVITGAGRGIGREHALAYAREGAKIVVNDLGGEMDGTGSSTGPAGEVVDEIRGMGGEAIANGDDVSRLRRGRAAHSGRRRPLRHHRRAGEQRRHPARPHAGQHDHRRVGRRHQGAPARTFSPTRHAVEYWRNRTKAGETNDARIINTTSPSGIYGNVGQTNYGAAKAGIASFTIIAAMELERYGVTVNAIAPAALDPHDREPRHGATPRPTSSPRSSTRSTPPTSRPSSSGWAAPSRRASPAASSTSGRQHQRRRGLGRRTGRGQGGPLGAGRAGQDRARTWWPRPRPTPTWAGGGSRAMTTEATPPLPSRHDMDEAVHVIHDNADRLFLWDYERDRDSWSRSTTRPWGRSGTACRTWTGPSRSTPSGWWLSRTARCSGWPGWPGTLPGSPLASWTEREFTQLGIELFKASLSQFMHGEQGAMMTAAKIVETVPWIDAKYYASTQTMDEARHTEVFAKYLRTKLGEAYPMSPFLKAQIWSLLEDSRWDIAYLGMQIVIESLALAAFGDMLRRTEEPLLAKLLRYVMSDEARHVAFGVLTLSEFYADLSEAELLERQEFLVDATLNSRARATTPEVWERMGTTADEVMPFIVEAAQKTKLNPMRRVRPRLLRQARAQRAQARPARRQQRLPAREVGRGRPARVRVRRRHRLGLRDLRRRGPGPGGAARRPAA